MVRAPFRFALSKKLFYTSPCIDVFTPYSQPFRIMSSPFILTLVAAPDAPCLTPAIVNHVAARLPSNPGGLAWRPGNRACDLGLTAPPSRDDLRLLRDFLAPHRTDLFVTTPAIRAARLFLADMDSTMIADETLDAVAAAWGVGDQVAAITARAMAGELDFTTALAGRLDLLRGVPIDVLHQIRDHLTPNPGARTLLATLQARGIHCVLISGGFTLFTQHVAQRLRFNAHHGTALDLQGGQMTGRLIEPIVRKETKAELLQEYAQQMDITLAQVVAVGDGANDLLMLQAAGLGVGYHPKQRLRDSLDNLILHGDLTALIYALGLTPENEPTP